MTDETNENNENKIEETRLPEIVPDDQKGVTEEEREYMTKQPARPTVPRWCFVLLAAMIVCGCACSGLWYYYKSILPEKLFFRADENFAAEKYDAAAGLYERVEKIRPERKGVFRQLGLCYEKLGRWQDAAAQYEKFLKKINPDDNKTRLRLGWIYADRLNEVERGRDLMLSAAKKLKEPYAWSLVGQAAAKSQNLPLQVEALKNQVSLFKNFDQIMTCSRSLVKLGAWKEALAGFEKAAGLQPENADAKHALISVRTALGYPKDAEHTAAAGKALGAVIIGASKQEVKAAIGGASPDKKEFPFIKGNAILPKQKIEVWYYGKCPNGQQALTIIFISNRVEEIATSSAEYKTANGICLSNYAAEKNKDRFEAAKRNGKLTLTEIKGHGLTFISSEDGKTNKLCVHKGGEIRALKVIAKSAY